MSPIPLRRRIMDVLTGMIIAGLAVYCITDMVRWLMDTHRVYAAPVTDRQAERGAMRANELAARRQRFVEILHDDTPRARAIPVPSAGPDAGACARSAVRPGTNVVGGSG